MSFGTGVDNAISSRTAWMPRSVTRGIGLNKTGIPFHRLFRKQRIFRLEPLVVGSLPGAVIFLHQMDRFDVRFEKALHGIGILLDEGPAAHHTGSGIDEIGLGQIEQNRPSPLQIRQCKVEGERRRRNSSGFQRRRVFGSQLKDRDIFFWIKSQRT